MNTDQNEKKKKVTLLDVLSGATALICVGVYIGTRFRYGGSLNHYTEKLFAEYPVLAPGFLSVTFVLSLLHNIQELRRGAPLTPRRLMHIIFAACFGVGLLFWIIFKLRAN